MSFAQAMVRSALLSGSGSATTSATVIVPIGVGIPNGRHHSGWVSAERIRSLIRFSG